MAKARALDRRRKSIKSIRKITRTMELIATACFKKAMDRAIAATAYTNRITKLVRDLTHSGTEIVHPLLDEREATDHATLVVLTANRGMCAGYNGNVIRAGNERLTELKGEYESVRLEVSGKRGISNFRFRKIIPDETYTHFEDKPTYDEVDALASRYLAEYETGKLDRLDIAYTKFESLGRQTAVVETLLPLGGLDHEEDAEEDYAGAQYEFLPSAESILDDIVPMSFRVKLFKCFLDAAVSEQIARMMAMKAATENADSMIKHLSMEYNRARQGQITGELLEIIGGADALSG
ncbi:MAG: ATP synthase F1 subunit gamma [Planctomycetia bacterium]